MIIIIKASNNSNCHIICNIRKQNWIQNKNSKSTFVETTDGVAYNYEIYYNQI